MLKKLFVSFQTISKWEKDENEPDISTIKKIAEIFECSIGYLFNDEETNPTEITEEKSVDNVIVVHQKELHVCERCKQDIPDNELEMEQICVQDGDTKIYKQAYYHKHCLEELKKERAEKERRIRKRKTKTFIRIKETTRRVS